MFKERRLKCEPIDLVVLLWTSGRGTWIIGHLILICIHESATGNAPLIIDGAPFLLCQRCLGCWNNHGWFNQNDWNTRRFNHQPEINRKMIESTRNLTAGWNNQVTTGHLVIQLKRRLIQPSTKNQSESGWNSQCFNWWLKQIVLNWEIVWEKDWTFHSLSNVTTLSACNFWAL